MILRSKILSLSSINIIPTSHWHHGIVAYDGCKLRNAEPANSLYYAKDVFITLYVTSMLC